MSLPSGTAPSPGHLQTRHTVFQAVRHLTPFHYSSGQRKPRKLGSAVTSHATSSCGRAGPAAVHAAFLDYICNVLCSWCRRHTGRRCSHVSDARGPGRASEIISLVRYIRSSLCCDLQLRPKEDQEAVLSCLSPEELAGRMDLRPFMQRHPYVVASDASMSRAYRLFRTMGLRHIFVGPPRPKVRRLLLHTTFFRPERAHSARHSMAAAGGSLHFWPYVLAEAGQNRWCSSCWLFRPDAAGCCRQSLQRYPYSRLVCTASRKQTCLFFGFKETKQQHKLKSTTFAICRWLAW